MAARRNAVVLAADARLFPAAVFAAERLARLNNRTDTDIAVFTNSEAAREQAAGLALPFAVRPVIAPKQFTDASFFRLFALEALTGEYARVLYIDVDTWVEDARLFALFDLDMAGHPFAAVRDAVVAFVPGLSERVRVLGPNNTKYLNAGVLMVDAPRYASGKTLARLLKIIRGGPLLHRDQSALNLLLKGDWLELSPAFNQFSIQWGTFVSRVCPPVVVHFTGAAKPWSGPKFRLAHPARAEMERYFPRSPWKDFLPGFVDLRAALQPSQPPADDFDGEFRGKDAYIRFLRETEFADVRAGIATLHLDRLPARG